MLTHRDLADYVASLDDPGLMEFAARVVAWRALLSGSIYPEWTLLMRCLVAAHNGFADRGWNHSHTGGNSWIDPRSPWGKTHARARVLTADSTPERARKQIAAWAGTVQLQAA